MRRGISHSVVVSRLWCCLLLGSFVGTVASELEECLHRAGADNAPMLEVISREGTSSISRHGAFQLLAGIGNSYMRCTGGASSARHQPRRVHTPSVYRKLRFRTRIPTHLSRYVPLSPPTPHEH